MMFKEPDLLEVDKSRQACFYAYFVDDQEFMVIFVSILTLNYLCMCSVYCISVCLLEKGNCKTLSFRVGRSQKN